MNPVLFSILEIEVHLPYVGVSEAAEFEVNDYQRTQSAVEKHEINPVPFVADP